MYGLFLLCGVLAVPVPTPVDAMTISARVEEGSRAHDIVLEVLFKEGWNGSGAGVPAPILQIDVPPSARLTGRVLKSHRELARNDFLQEPFEQLLKGSSTRVGFRLPGESAPGEAFGLSVLVYLSRDGTDDAWFVRRRLELPVTPGSTARSVSAATSDWGEGDLLQIGDQAAPFSLPKADGTKLALSEYLGKKNIIVTTYRAHW